MTDVVGIDRRGGEALLTFAEVRRVYGSPPSEVTALDGVSLEVRQGEMLAVMGPSGSGKSTLLMIGGGLEAPTSGAVEFEGKRLWDLPPAELAGLRRRSIGYVFQEFNLLSSLTAAENVSAPLELDGVGAKEARNQAIGALELVGLADRASAFPDDLSGGERQRVAIARGLIGDRTLLLADEPTGALDSENGGQILDLLRIACTSDAAVVVVTHDADVAARADRIVRLRDGRLEADTAATQSAAPVGATAPGNTRGQR